jgi:uncharacterized protein
MRHLDFPLDAKDVGDDGQIEGLAAVYGNVDFGGADRDRAASATTCGP